MTERRGDQGFSVPPQRIGGDGGPGRSRARRIGLALVLAAAAAVVTIAWIGPRLSDRPSFDTSFFATPRPSDSSSPSPTPTVEPLTPIDGTPLPSITRPDGPIPIGLVAVQTDALHVLDLASGSNTTGPPTQFFRDAVVPSTTEAGWTCMCFVDGQDTGGPNLTMRITAIGPTGTETDSTDVAALPSLPLTEDGQPSLTTDVDTFNGGRTGLLALARRNGDGYRFTLSTIDIEGRRLGAAVRIGDATPPPAPSPPQPAASDDPAAGGPDYLYDDGPHIRIAPDGRTAFIWALVQRANYSQSASSSAIHAWRVAIRPDGSIGEVTDAPGLRAMPLYCGTVGFATADRLAWLCPRLSTDQTFNGVWQFGTLDLDGNPAGSVDLTLATDGYGAQPLFDRANGITYVWDASGLTVARIDVHTMAVEQMTFDPLAESSTGLSSGGGTAPVDWHSTSSAVTQSGINTISGGLDGQRLYAVGFGAQPSSNTGNAPSLGIFVIDRSTLALVDRWAAAADYLGVTALPNGLVAASGLPSVNEHGQPAPWEASLTIHEAVDGRILVRFGQLGNNYPPVVVGR
jgi:hypothetical protein